MNKLNNRDLSCSYFKHIKEFLIAFMIVQAACSSKPSSIVDTHFHNDSTLIELDVTKTYPRKEYCLQDIAHIEYVKLETRTDVIVTGGLCAVTDKEIVFNEYTSGDILFFNKDGEFVRKINRKGEGPDEYLKLNDTPCYDSNSKELFVTDFFKKKILVYDVEGNYKRELRYPDIMLEEGIAKNPKFCYLKNYNSDELLTVFKTFRTLSEIDKYIIISKKTGEIKRIIEIPDKEYATLNTERHSKEGEIFWLRSTHINVLPIIPHSLGFNITNTSSDTIYRLNKEYQLCPLLVRTPEVKKMEEPIFIVGSLETQYYYFLVSIKKIQENLDESGYPKNGYPETCLIYDKRERSFFESNVVNKDWQDKDFFISMKHCYFEIGPNKAVIRLYAHELVEAYQNNLLSGKLKEIAAGLNEEDNPILMKVTFKN